MLYTLDYTPSDGISIPIYPILPFFFHEFEPDDLNPMTFHCISIISSVLTDTISLPCD